MVVLFKNSPCGASGTEALGDTPLVQAFVSVCKFEFENTYEGALTLDMMIDDFDLVPVITNLDETAANTNCIFSTKHVTDKNILFEQMLNNNNGELD